MVATTVRTQKIEWGANELERESTLVWVRPVVTLFGKTVWRGQETLSYEFVHRWLHRSMS